MQQSKSMGGGSKKNRFGPGPVRRVRAENPNTLYI